MFLEKAFSQATATQEQKGKQAKTISHASRVSRSLQSPILQHVTYCGGIFTAGVGYGGNVPDSRWDRGSGRGQHLPLILPKKPSKGEALREACAFL